MLFGNIKGTYDHKSQLQPHTSMDGKFGLMESDQQNIAWSLQVVLSTKSLKNSLWGPANVRGA